MVFNEILEASPDPIFGKLGLFQSDARSNKINLMVGIFKDANLQSELIPAVRRAKAEIRDDLADYLPMDGLPEFGQLVGPLAFGRTWDHGKIFAAQTVGGTSALRVGAEFLAQEIGKKVYLPHPTWGNHRNIFERAGFQVDAIPYYNPQIHRFDRTAYLERIDRLEPKSIVLFHVCCHNPTGSDPSLEDWREISDLCKKRSLVPFFDFAYQGFGEGIEEDSQAIRLFAEKGHDFLVAYSCSKNFSLYCQRVGALFAVCANPATKLRVGSQIKRIIRGNYSNPPAHGARIVAHILQSPELSKEWRGQVDHMRRRISHMRQMLTERLEHFPFLRHHKGMFSYLDLTAGQTQELIDRYAIYTLESGRMNVAGVTVDNIDAIVDGIRAVSKQ